MGPRGEAAELEAGAGEELEGPGPGRPDLKPGPPVEQAFDEQGFEGSPRVATASARQRVATASAPRSGAPTNREAEAQRVADATAYVADLIVRLEAAGDRAKVSEETYLRDTRDRDALVAEANAAGLSQQFIAELSGLGTQPAVARAKRRHRERTGTGAGR